MTEPRLRVLFVTTTTYVVRHVLIHDLRSLQNRIDATVVCANGPDLPELRSEGIRVFTIPIRRKVSPLADIRAIWCILRLLRRERFHLLHSYVPKGGFVGQIAGWLARVPHRIHSCRGLLYTPMMPRWKRWIIRGADRLTNALAHRTIFNSRADFDYCISEGLCSSSSARYGGSGIDLAHYNPDRLPSDIRRRVRQEIGIPQDAPVILTIGRFVIDKGYRELAGAAAIVRQRNPSVRFVWVAPVVDGEEDVLPDTLLESPELGGSIMRLPQQKDLRRLYAAADLLALPSYREGVPRVLMEAAAMRLPIVASDIPGCREVVSHGTTGILCPPRNAPALADALCAVMHDPDGTRQRAVAAELDVRSRFDQDSHAERAWEIYGELLQGSAR